jgi:restriction system protein
VFQCKRYSKKVGNKAVQEVAAAKVHYGASEAGIMTNSELTPNAKKLAYENKVVIYEKIW